jgi:hypothetical protein
VIISKVVNTLIVNPLLHIVVEGSAFTKNVTQLFLNIINTGTAIIINPDHTLESKVVMLLVIYKSRWGKKNFYSKKLDKSFSLQVGHNPLFSLSSQKGLRHWSQSCTCISLIKNTIPYPRRTRGFLVNHKQGSVLIYSLYTN